MTVNKRVDACYPFCRNPFFANNERLRPNNGAFFIRRRRIAEGEGRRAKGSA